MKSLIGVLLLFVLGNLPDLTEIRSLYVGAGNSEPTAKILNGKLESVDPQGDKALVAYKGAALTLQAKFSGKLQEKIRLMKKGAGLIDGAATTEPNNVEIRLIRLSVQENVPAIVNYRKNKKEDKAYILAHYKSLEGALKTYVKNFMLQSKSFTDQEKAALK